MSSISQTDASFRQNHKNLEEYAAILTRGELPVERGCLLSEDDRNRRTLVMDIMCRRRFDFADLGRRLNLDVAQAYAAELATLSDLAADGLLHSDAGGFDITPLGELFRRVIAMRFDAYLGRGPRKFSRTV
jgi:oxygen-independent coproporphyrinogen-3 oxidase